MKQFQCLLLASFLFLMACKKGDVTYANCFIKPPTCLPSTLWEEDEFLELRTVVHYDMSPIGDVPAYLTPTYNPPGDPRDFKIHYVGNYLYMIDDHYPDWPDTLLIAKLDNCKRPITSWFRYLGSDINLRSIYTYNSKGQLTKIVVTGSAPDVINYTYDHRGNVISIVSNRMKHLFKYDYSRPFSKGVIYGYNFIRDDLFHMAPHSYFEWIGHFDLTPGNLRTASEFWVDNVLRDKKSYDNYLFEDAKGNVSGYTGHDLLTVPHRKHFYRLLWHCSLLGN